MTRTRDYASYILGNARVLVSGTEPVVPAGFALGGEAAE